MSKVHVGRLDVYASSDKAEQARSTFEGAVASFAEAWSGAKHSRKDTLAGARNTKDSHGKVVVDRTFEYPVVAFALGVGTRDGSATLAKLQGKAEELSAASGGALSVDAALAILRGSTAKA